MADLTKTVTESVRTFGLAETTKWNNFLWGVGNWGEPGEIIQLIGKSINESASTTDVLSLNVAKLLQDITEAGFVQMAAYDTKLSDGSGYSYVFPGGVSDAEEQVITDFTRQSNGSTAWTKQSDGSTSWS